MERLGLAKDRVMSASRVAKSILATAGTGLPALVPIYFPEKWTVFVLTLYLIGVIIAWWFVFEPDQRFTQVRDPTLDSAFDQTFAEDFGDSVDPAHPFRVH